MRSSLPPRASAKTVAARRVCVLADDLTGACDAAVAFAARGLVTEVATAAHGLASAATEVWAVNAGTRDVEPGELTRVLGDALRALPACEMLFKKIDSVFRGNTMLEIRTIVSLLPEMHCILAPAFPALGRTSRGGVLEIADAAGAGVSSLPVVAALRAQGLQLEVLETGLPEAELRARLAASWQQGARVVYCDAASHDDLLAVVRAARALSETVLWIGSGGLAHALAETIPQSIAAPPARQIRGRHAVFFIGSRHPLTQRQMQALNAHAGSFTIIDVPRGEITADEIRQAVCSVAADETSCLFMTGGDTAALVCDALGITSLRIEREFAPGLPEAVAVGGRFDGVPVLLKSGGFGTLDVLYEIADVFAPASPPAAASSALPFQSSGDLQ